MRLMSIKQRIKWCRQKKQYESLLSSDTAVISEEGRKETTQYLSQGKNSVAVYSREQYDERYYNHIQSGNLTKGYNMGTVFKIGGKEYAVNGDGIVS